MEISKNRKTEYNFMVYVLCIILLVFSGMLINFYFKSFYNNSEISPFAYYAFSLIVIVFVLFAILYPIIKIYSVEISEDVIIYKWTFLPIKKKYNIADIDGYYTTMLQSRDASYLTFYLTKNQKVLPSISTFNFDNASEFVNELNLKFLGNIKFTWTFFLVDITLLKRIPANSDNIQR